MTDPTTARPSAPLVGAGLAAVAIIGLAFNLRPAAASVGPVLDELTSALGVGPTIAGVLTTLPVLAFAVFGALAPTAAGRIGPHRIAVLALACVIVGQGARVLVSDPVSFLLLSLLALAGMATGNVVLPSLVRLHFPRRIGMMTAAYTTSLALGLTAASALTVPLAEAFAGSVEDGWRTGLVVWAIAAGAALVPWLLMLRADRVAARRTGPAPSVVRMRAIAGTRLGWAMAILFGTQSLQAYVVFGWFAQLYRDAGFDPTTAGILLGVITGVGIPLSIVIPVLTARLVDPRPLLVGLVFCVAAAYLGLLLAPADGAWLWAVLLGTGLSIFPMVLTLIGLRARTAATTAALSGFTQSAGYLIAAVGPIGMGVLHDLTGSWDWPLIVLLGMLVPLLVSGLVAARPGTIEDELELRPR
ncbi:MFS transporter [Nocardioides massiliensis]|uniref:CP family cyanate transporter-like MFS transporter n=1 Tax=Nocardioides massiliensis TaxID=1325935 RepID=A0ABT9NPN2_9ACTN|nr:MFS transporter [Nocardioides massiliensis]MDP9822370.1 CP family cyanate transporter-like MFS transporter [Nocardioides massiliensis]